MKWPSRCTHGEQCCVCEMAQRICAYFLHILFRSLIVFFFHIWDRSSLGENDDRGIGNKQQQLSTARNARLQISSSISLLLFLFLGRVPGIFGGAVVGVVVVVAAASQYAGTANRMN